MKKEHLVISILVLVFSLVLTDVFAQSATVGLGGNIQYGTKGSTSVSSSREIGKSKMSRRDCLPGAGICRASANASVKLGTKAKPASAPVVFALDTLIGNNFSSASKNCLSMLIHTDSASNSMISGYLHTAANAPQSSLISQLQSMFGPTIVNTFAWIDDFNIGVDPSNLSILGIPDGQSGIFIPKNTLCIISRPNSDTNYYRITFVGVIANRLYFQPGNPTSNCDSSELSICSIVSPQSNANAAFYTIQITSDTTAYITIYMNKNNIIACDSGLATVFENFDYQLPGTIATKNSFNFSDYSYLPDLQGWTIAAQNSAGTLLPNNWGAYSFTATPSTTAAGRRMIKGKKK